MADVKKVAFFNAKGGVGKTTSIFHTAGVLAKEGEKVLVVDFDKQRNTSDTLLMNTCMPVKTVYDFMQGTATADDCTQKALFQSRGNAHAKYYNVDCMVADVLLENQLDLQGFDKETFANSLNDYIVQNGYTWVLVDMPPSNKILNEIAFEHIVDYVIVPFSSDIFSVTGYRDVMATLQEAREKNPTLNILGVFLARYMRNCAVDKYIREQLLEFDTFIDVQIPLTADVRESVMFGRPISYYKVASNSKSAYEKLVSTMKKIIKSFN